MIENKREHYINRCHQCGQYYCVYCSNSKDARTDFCSEECDDKYNELRRFFWKDKTKL